MRAFVAQVFTDRAACDRALNLLVDRVDPPALDQRLVPAHPLMTTMKVWTQQYAAAGPFVSPFTNNTKMDVANLERNPHLLLPVFSRPAGGRPKAKQPHADAKRKQHGGSRSSKLHKPSHKPSVGGGGGAGGWWRRRWCRWWCWW